MFLLFFPGESLMTEKIPPKQLAINCCNTLPLQNCILVWEMLATLQKKHFCGPSIEEIVNETKLSLHDVQSVLSAFTPTDPKDSCVLVRVVQEGTAGPFATRFSQKRDVIPHFKYRYYSAGSYQISLLE